MKRETFRAPSGRSAASTGPVASACRAILAVDQIIEMALRKAELSRPDFDMLLDIHVAELEGRSICMWDVCQTAAIPFSTAHRRLSVMVDRGLVERLAPRGDWRRVIVGLSADARAIINTITAALNSRYEISRVEDVAGIDEVAKPPRATEA